MLRGVVTVPIQGLKNRLKRKWQVTRDPALKPRVNRFHRSVIIG
jgi:hypothetical protein